MRSRQKQNASEQPRRAALGAYRKSNWAQKIPHAYCKAQRASGERRKTSPPIIQGQNGGGKERRTPPSNFRKQPNTEGEVPPPPNQGCAEGRTRFDSGDPPRNLRGLGCTRKVVWVCAPRAAIPEKPPLPVLMGKWELSPRSQGQATAKAVRQQATGLRAQGSGAVLPPRPACRCSHGP